METGTIYRTTKAQCQEQIDKLNHVCDGCGGHITPIETEDNGGNPTFWAGCTICQVFTHGVKKIYFDIASHLVRVRNYRAYHHTNEPDKADQPAYAYWEATQIRGISSQVSEIINTYKKLI